MIKQIKNIMIRSVFLALCVFSLLTIQAQERVVTGTVRGPEGSPLSGATVTIGDQKAVTGFDGSFQISVPEGATTISASASEYGSVELSIPDNNVANFTLSSKTQALEDVVVVAYGSVSAEDLTGAVSYVSDDDFTQGIINSPDQLIQGRIAGVNTFANSGEPGSGATVQIRGVNSIRSGNGPLYVVDGFPLTDFSSSASAEVPGFGTTPPSNPLNFLNPDDIASITVLKDASASAIYGARGANGVIIVTTKSGGGSKGTSNLSVNISTGFSTPLRKYDLLSRDDFIRLAGIAAGIDADSANRRYNLGLASNKTAGDGPGQYPASIAGQDVVYNTDWQDAILRTALQQNYNISYGASAGNTNYRFSVGYLGQEGIIKTSNFERFAVRGNIDQSFLDNKIKINSQLSYSRVNQRRPLITNDAGFEGSLIGMVFNANPSSPIYSDPATGRFLQIGNDRRNPVAALQYYADNTVTDRFLGNVGITVDLYKGLKYKFKGGIDQSRSERGINQSREWNIADVFGLGRAEVFNTDLNSILTESILEWGMEKGKSKVDVLGGFAYQRYQTKFVSVNATRFQSGQVEPINNLGFAATTFQGQPFVAYRADSEREEYEIQSFFARATYDYDSKYYLTASFRADGSSRFGPNNRYGYFPSVAGAWTISNEGFFAGVKNVLNFLKLRASWGQQGNQEFPANYTSLALLTINNAGDLQGINNPNSNIKWETVTQIDVGLDFEFLDNKVSGSVDYFNKVTSDLIYQQDFAQPAGVDFVWRNLGAEVVNSGVEITLNYAPISTTDFAWNINYNMTFLQNTVRNVPFEQLTGALHGQGLSGTSVQRITDGQPLNAFFLREWTGFNEEGFSTYAQEDGSRSTAFDDAPFKAFSPIPDLTYALTNTLTYKQRLSLSFTFTAQTGGYVYNNTANNSFVRGSLVNNRNVTYEAANTNESPTNPNSASTRFLEKSDFVRLQNLSLSYDVNTSKISKYVKGIKVYVTGQNLLLFTGYSGIDPQVNIDKTLNGVPSASIDYQAFPSARTILIGVNLNL